MQMIRNEFSRGSHINHLCLIGAKWNQTREKNCNFFYERAKKTVENSLSYV